VPPISTTCYGPLLVKQVRNMWSCDGSFLLPQIFCELAL
jgi:hypothetical protein